MGEILTGSVFRFSTSWGNDCSLRFWTCPENCWELKLDFTLLMEQLSGVGELTRCRTCLLRSVAVVARVNIRLLPSLCLLDHDMCRGKHPLADSAVV